VQIESIDDSITHFQKLFPTKVTNSVAIGFACSSNAPERMLQPNQWANFILKKNLDPSTQIILLGGPQDRKLGEDLKQEIEKVTNLVCINQCGNLTLNGSIQAISSASQYFGIDSGLLHIARLLGKDTTSFWGPTDPNTRLAPRSLGKDSIHYQKITCSPCVHFASTPPCLGKNRCIDAIFDAKIASQYITWAVLPENTSATVELTK
jgi:ADP-heptose:LPS heptosyltransferase